MSALGGNKCLYDGRLYAELFEVKLGRDVGVRNILLMVECQQISRLMKDKVFKKLTELYLIQGD